MHVSLATVWPWRSFNTISMNSDGSHCHVLIVLASATLLFLNGLKSSLTLTTDFFSGLLPKNGLGVLGACNASQMNDRCERSVFTDSAALGLGDADADAEAEAALGFGDVGPCSEENVGQCHWICHDNMFDITGVKAFALGLGLKDDAFAFSRFAAVVGEVGGAAAALAAMPFVCGADGRALFPLNGGIAWIYILMVAFPLVFPGSAGFVVAGDFALEGIAGAVGAAARGFAEAAGGAGLRVTSGETLAEACGIRDALDEVFKDPGSPIARAVKEDASREALSRICCCLPSSLARMGTRSSGMGLFS